MQITLKVLPGTSLNKPIEYSSLRGELTLDNGVVVNVSQKCIKLKNLYTFPHEVLTTEIVQKRGKKAVERKLIAVNLFDEEYYLFQSEGDTCMATSVSEVSTCTTTKSKEKGSLKIKQIKDITFLPTGTKAPATAETLIKNTYDINKVRHGKSKTEMKLNKTPLNIVITH